MKMIPRKAIWLLSLLLVIAVFSLISPIPEAQADDEIQGVVADVSQSWMIYTNEDNMSNVDSIWGKHWYFRIVNYTQEDIDNPKVTVETPLELVWLYPSPITTGPPIYEWTASVVPCGSWFLAGGVENEYIVGRPRFSVSRSVSPDRLAEDITVQTAVVEFKLEEPLPPEVNEVSVVIGFYPISTPHPLTPILVDYTLLTYENTPLTENDEDWEVFLHGTSGIQWYTLSPNSVEIGKTYEFEATFEVVKSESLEGAPVSKPDVNAIWRKIESEHEKGTSVTIDYPYEDLTATFQTENLLEWTKIISSSYRFVGFSSFITPIVGTEPPFHSLESFSFTLHSSADLHVYDPAGRHVGLNYITDEEEIEIPDATYERNAVQVITIPEPTYGNYRVVLVGTSTGPYELIIEGATETETFLAGSYSGEIETGATHETTVTVPTEVGELQISALKAIPSAPSPAAFEVSNLSVTPSKVKPGEEVRIAVDVTNVGELASIYTLSLRVNTIVESSPTIALAGGETRKVVFTTVRDAAGAYEVEIGGMLSSFTIAQPRACFIATAAYGTPMPEEIENLRKFRDEYLLTNAAGRALVQVYYRISPAIAEFITEHPSLKPIMRVGLVPAVAISTIAVNTTLAEKTALAGLLVLVSVALAIWAAKRRGRGPEYT